MELVKSSLSDKVTLIKGSAGNFYLNISIRHSTTEGINDILSLGGPARLKEIDQNMAGTIATLRERIAEVGRHHDFDPLLPKGRIAIVAASVGRNEKGLVKQNLNSVLVVHEHVLLGLVQAKGRGLACRLSR